MNAATNLHETTQEEADLITGDLDSRERADLDTSYGVVERGRRPRDYNPALAAMEKSQKTRAKRRHLDVVDRSLMDLASVYRDAIALATGGGELVNEEIRPASRRSSALPLRSSTCAGSGGSSTPANRCSSSTCPCRSPWSR